MKTAFVFSSLLALLFSSAPSNAAEQWPIKVLKIDELKKAELAQDQDKPNTSQPEAFDPAHFKSLKDIPQDANFQHAKKLTQTGALAITEYYFDTDDEPSFLLDIKKSSKRHGLYTHIDQYMFSPNYETLLLDNTVKQANGKWRSLRRVIDVNSKASTQLPDVDCTRFQGFAANSGFVTYGSGTKKADDSFGPPREVCVWGKDAKLKSALSVPLQNTLANSEASANAVGLLPSDETVLFQLAYDNKRCILRLQSLSQKRTTVRSNCHKDILLGTTPRCSRLAISASLVKTRLLWSWISQN